MSANWKVTADGFETGGNIMKASCHHRIGRGSGRLSACGGCYARATTALQIIADDGNEIAREVIAAMRSERKPAAGSEAA